MKKLNLCLLIIFAVLAAAPAALADVITPQFGLSGNSTSRQLGIYDWSSSRTFIPFATIDPTGHSISIDFTTEQISARSVLANCTNAAAVPIANQGTANQVLRVNSAGTSCAFGQVNLASSAAVTGVLPIANGGTNASAAGGTALDNISAISTTGYVKRTASATYSTSLEPKTLVATLTATAASELATTSAFSATYAHYDVYLENVYPATNASTLSLEVYSGGSYQTTNYLASGMQGNTSGAGSLGGLTINFQLTNTTTSVNALPGLSGHFHIDNTSATNRRKNIFGQCMYNSTASNPSFIQFVGYWNGGDGAITGFRIRAYTVGPAYGNITGTAYVYGYN